MVYESLTSHSDSTQSQPQLKGFTIQGSRLEPALNKYIHCMKIWLGISTLLHTHAMYNESQDYGGSKPCFVKLLSFLPQNFPFYSILCPQQSDTQSQITVITINVIRIRFFVNVN